MEFLMFVTVTFIWAAASYMGSSAGYTFGTEVCWTLSYGLDTYNSLRPDTDITTPLQIASWMTHSGHTVECDNEMRNTAAFMTNRLNIPLTRRQAKMLVLARYFGTFVIYTGYSMYLSRYMLVHPFIEDRGLDELFLRDSIQQENWENRLTMLALENTASSSDGNNWDNYF